MTVSRKKLIEVALPLDAINAASAREKSIRHGHPSTLHLWWARRPLAAARAVIFAQMVDDPAACPEEFPTEEDQKQERERLFRLIEELVRWENTTNEELLEQARAEIRRSWRRTCAGNAEHPRAAELFDPDNLPAFHDPFAGGGALPLEAQRLGLEAHASDLNPVAVLISKAMIEIPPKFAGRPPVNPEARPGGSSAKASLIERGWTGAQGLAEDVRYYGKWMRDEAERRIGHLYPPVEVTAEMVRERPDLKQYQGRKLTVIAWLWARTVKSPNPAFADIDVPLVTTFMLSTKRGKEAYVEPAIEGRGYRFAVKVGKPTDADAAKAGTKSGGSGKPFLCLMSGTPMPFDYLRSEAKSGRMSERLMAIVAEGDRERVYLTPSLEQEVIAKKAEPQWTPDTNLPERALGFRVQEYGMLLWRDLFTPRQLVALTTFSDLVAEAMERVKQDAAADLPEDGIGLDSGGCGVTAYAEAIAVYLAFSVSKTSNRASTLCTFKISVECPGDTFGRQALPMSWDYAESNAVAGPTGSFDSMLSNTIAGLLSNGASLICIDGCQPPPGWSFRVLSSHGFFADRRDAVATVDPTDIRGLATACPGCVAERPQSRVEGQPERRLIVLSRILLTGPFCPVSIYMSKGPMPASEAMSGSGGDPRPPGHETAGAFLLPGDGPDETQKLPRDRGADFVLRHPSPTQPSIASAQAFLCLPGDGLYGGCGLFGASLQGDRLAGGKSIAPGRFHQHAPHVGVARLGNRPSLLPGPAGMLAGDQTDKGHQLARRVEAGEVSQLGQGRNRGERVYPAQRPQSVRLPFQRPSLQGLLQRLIQPLDPTLGFLYRVHGFLKDDLLGRVIEALGLQPAKVGLGPATAPGIDSAVALQEAVKPLAHAALGVLEVFPAALQVAHRLLRFVRHPDGRQLAVLEKPGQRQRIAPVGLDAVARPTRDQRGRHHRAGVPQGCELTVDAVAAGPGLVAKPQRGPRAGELGRQLGQRGARRRYRPIQFWPLGTLTGKRDGDRIFMYVQGDEFRRFTHGLLLFAGDRSLGELSFPKDNPRQPKSEEVFHIPVNT